MQETKYEGQTVQRIFQGKSEEEIQRMMDGALRRGEELVRRVPLDRPTVHAMNRHERRTAQSLARRANRGPK